MMFLWALCGVPFGVYAIVQKFNIPIQIQPQCFCCLCLVSWGQCLRYGRLVHICLFFVCGHLLAEKSFRTCEDDIILEECKADFVSVSSKWRVWTSTLITVALGLLFAGLEVLFISEIRGPYSRGVSWPVTLMGVLATVLILSGYIPIPFEIAKRRGRVIGIDFVFLTIDWLGAVFSAMALGMCLDD